MLRSYIIIAFRSMKRNMSYTMINVLGLSVGVACCLMLAVYIQHEASYDQHHRGKDNLYRVTTTITHNGERGNPMGHTSAPIVWGIKEEIPEFEAVARLVSPLDVSLNLIRYEDNQFFEPDGFIADSTLFDIFTYHFIEGDPETALKEPNSVVITQRLANKIFGKEPALDKIITIDQGGSVAEYRVTAVVAENTQSHIKASFFVSITSDSPWCDFLRSPNVVNEWVGQNFMLSYVRLSPGHDATEVVSKMNSVLAKHAGEAMRAAGMSKELGLEPLADIHLYSEVGGRTPGVTYLYVVGTIGGFILFLACINFINLSTAKATRRAGEVGMRKTLGAQRQTLMVQFLSESMAIVVIAILISIILVSLGIPLLNELTGIPMTLESIDLKTTVAALLCITLITGLMAGSYPAFYLSCFRPAAVLKAASTVSSSTSFVRRGLVVVQFVVAIALVCGVLVVGKQLNYIQEKELGFDAAQKIVLPLRTKSSQEKWQALANELRRESFVDGVTATRYIPGSYIWTDFHVYAEGGNAASAIHFRRNAVEPNYLDVLNIDLVSGRTFSPERSADADVNVVVNRQAVKALGFTPETIIGQPLYFEWRGERFHYLVVGVMDDFHQESLKKPIYPLLLFVEKTPSHDYMIVSIHDGHDIQSLQTLERLWKQINPDTPFEYAFLEENISRQYVDDKRMAKLVGAFTIVALIISSLGLYGLSSYMAERRFKEIGVRKVLGATVPQIVGMMSTEFIRLVVVAFIIAAPIAWYGTAKWLEDFAYKVEPGALVFLAAGGITLLVCVFTVCFESFRAANTNPANALRSE